MGSAGGLLAIIAVVAIVGVGGYLLLSNGGGDDGDDINQLISSYFDEYTEQEPTDTIVELTDSELKLKGYSVYSTDGYQYVYTKHKATNTFDELTCLGTMDNAYYPGAIILLSYDKDGNTVIKSANIERAPMVLSLGLETAKGVNTEYMSYSIEDPSLSNVRKAVSTMVNGAIESSTSIPCVMSCSIVEYSSDNSLAASLGIDVNTVKVGVDVGADYSKSTSMNRFALILKQVYFTVDMDRPEAGAAGVFSNGTKVEDISSAIKIGEIPVYCSVVYGKIAIITIETEMSASDFKAEFNFSYTNTVNIEASFSEICKNSNTSMSYFIYGGDKDEQGIITTSTVSDVVSLLAKSPTTSPKAIGYRFYNLDDGTIAHLSDYTEYIVRENQPIKIETIILSAEDGVTEVKPGDTVSFRETVSPSDAVVYNDKNYDVSCSSKYAYYDDAKKMLFITEDAKDIVGKTITVTLTIKQVIEGRAYTTSASCDLKVTNIPVESIMLETIDGKDTVTVGVSTTISATVKPTNATYGVESWIVDGDATYSYDGNKLSITAKSVGTILVTAIEHDGKRQSLTLTAELGGSSTHTVTVCDRGSIVKTFSVEDKDTITGHNELPALTREDEDGYSYTLKGWSVDGNIINPKSYPVIDDLTIDAVWEKTDLYSGWTRITSADSFKQTVESNLSGKYILMADLVLPGSFTPIGYEAGIESGWNTKFTGELNGNGHSIKYSIQMEETVNNNTSCFGLIAMMGNGALVYDMNVDASITVTMVSTKHYLCIGSIVGSINGNGSIYNCVSTIKVSDTNHLNDLSIDMCAGGIAGRTAGQCVITDCSAKCDIDIHGTWSYAGGIVGVVFSQSVVITHCYSEGSLQAYGHEGIFYEHRGAAGGMIAFLANDNNASAVLSMCASNCSKVKSQGCWQDSGGLIGCLHDSNNSATISDCVFLNTGILEFDNKRDDAVSNECGKVSKNNVYGYGNANDVKSKFDSYQHFGCLR